MDYEIPPEGYVISDSLSAKCVIPVSYISDKNKLMILGETFMRNFYASFDFD
jgi:hypothetical protein